MDLHYIIGGAIVGFIVGATGVGGGSLMTPLLTLGFGVPVQVAVGTDLLFAATTKAGGAVAHARRGSVSWPITAWMVAGSVPAAAITLFLLHQWVPDAIGLGRLLMPALGVALILTATALVFKTQIQALGRRWAARSPSTTTRISAAATEAGTLPMSWEDSDPNAVRPLPTGSWAW